MSGRLTALDTTQAGAGGGNSYSGSYEYNNNDQRVTATVSRTNAAGSPDGYQTTYSTNSKGITFISNGQN